MAEESLIINGSVEAIGSGSVGSSEPESQTMPGLHRKTSNQSRTTSDCYLKMIVLKSVLMLDHQAFGTAGFLDYWKSTVLQWRSHN
ncbi:hypothetical protein NQ318_017352 [Aromia moschata]|uniref:Uncharacterized protein n=1 Tax=Aromia moschata TaxID=1265417 RepID=A0AAV8XAW6_9CUCU|nr:hypothetical protein NQ318_017352 [Aromia moschata]